jgi:hypothetical protein
VKKQNNRSHAHRIAEDYAPFDVDVTTEAPASFGPITGHVLITPDTDANGTQMPAYGAGGVAMAGPLDLTVTPSWAAYERPTTSGRGTNLDVQATLYALGGEVVAMSDPLDETSARIAVDVAGGDYYLAITGVGNSVSPYTDYGSQGQYFIMGSVSASTPGESDTTAPTPDPMGWAAEPAALGPDTMSMTAATAADDSGGAVQYYFACVSGGAGCVDSGWQSSAGYTAAGLAAETAYDWEVKARDLAGNETGWSAVASARTDPAPLAPTAPVAPGGLTATDKGDGTASLSWADNSDNETGFHVVRESWHPKRNRWQSNTLVTTTSADVISYTDPAGSGLYRYYVEAYNDVGSAQTGWVEVTITDNSGGGRGGGCKGGPKKCP